MSYINPDGSNNLDLILEDVRYENKLDNGHCDWFMLDDENER
jgi:hypothetical protein